MHMCHGLERGNSYNMECKYVDYMGQCVDSTLVLVRVVETDSITM